MKFEDFTQINPSLFVFHTSESEIKHFIKIWSPIKQTDKKDQIGHELNVSILLFFIGGGDFLSRAGYETFSSFMASTGGKLAPDVGGPTGRYAWRAYISFL